MTQNFLTFLIPYFFPNCYQDSRLTGTINALEFPSQLAFILLIRASTSALVPLNSTKSFNNLKDHMHRYHLTSKSFPAYKATLFCRTARISVCYLSGYAPPSEVSKSCSHCLITSQHRSLKFGALLWFTQNPNLQSNIAVPSICLHQLLFAPTPPGYTSTQLP